MNRIPGKYLTVVCNLYDVEIMDVIHLTGSDKSFSAPVLLKPKNTLDTLMQVYLGVMTLDAASTALNASTKSLKSILFHWGDELPTLHTTLKQLDEGRITLTDACQRLKVEKYTLHGIRRKYGYAPGKIKRMRPLSDIGSRMEQQRQAALDVVAGRKTARQAANELGVSYRTIFRAVERMKDIDLNELTHWPRSFRIAFAEELARKTENYVEKWFDFAKNHKLHLPKHPKYPQTPEHWGGLPLKRLLVGVLLDESSIDAIAVSRGADPVILEGLFSQDLQPLGLTYEAVKAIGVYHQQALADLLLAMMDRRRVQEKKVKIEQLVGAAA